MLPLDVTRDRGVPLTRPGELEELQARAVGQPQHTDGDLVGAAGDAEPLIRCLTAAGPVLAGKGVVEDLGAEGPHEELCGLFDAGHGDPDVVDAADGHAGSPAPAWTPRAR